MLIDLLELTETLCLLLCDAAKYIVAASAILKSLSCAISCDMCSTLIVQLCNESQISLCQSQKSNQQQLTTNPHNPYLLLLVACLGLLVQNGEAG